MVITRGKVYEVLLRNLRKTKISDSAIILTIKDVKVSSGVFVFEGIKVDPETQDSVTFAKQGTSVEGLKIHADTYSVFRACGSPEDPTYEAKGCFSVYKPDNTKIATYEWPWSGIPIQKIGAWVDQQDLKDKPVQAYVEGPFNVTVSHKIHQALYPEVLIVGSGPLGATYARKIIEAGHEVLMVEMGAQESNKVGRHKKNAIAFQKDIDSFVNKSFTRNGQNPDQKDYDNLGAAAATRCVGGMSTHWTCATPRQHPILERSDLFSEAEWNTLYSEAEGYLRTSRNEFENSIRQQLVKEKLVSSFKTLFPGREVLSLPLACKRNVEDNPDYVTWSATDTILDLTVDSPKFHLLSNHQCMKVLYDSDDQNIIAATVKNLEMKNRLYVFAKKYVICGGSVLTPQILFNSGFRPVEQSLPALGHYLTEQTMTFCQVILKEEFVNEVAESDRPEWKRKVALHKLKQPEDPLPFPYNDPDPQITTPVSNDFPWHTQIHRDAFSYGDVAQTLDSRLVVDFRFFGMVEPEESNCVTFSTRIRDHFYMPQPTFHFVLGKAARERSHKMMQDMCTVATQIGGYLPGSEPQFMEPGLALHICGTTRAGNDKKTSVVDKNSKVWDVKNLWLGGNNIIPTRNACNPTLTSMCFAIKGAEKLIAELKN